MMGMVGGSSRSPRGASRWGQRLPAAGLTLTTGGAGETNPAAGPYDVQARHVATVEDRDADLHRCARRRGRGDAEAAGLIVDRERRKLRRNYAKLSQPKPMQAGAAPAFQLLDLL
jgi:hypothetical protein